MIAREIRLLLTAWVFFTRIGLPAALARWTGYSPDMLRGSARYFPLVGMLIGAIGAAVYLAGDWLFTPVIAVVLSTITTVLVTGAFHEDGFADGCDGFGGGYTRERVLEIMTDSCVGAFGAIGITLMLALKLAALAALAEGGDAGLLAWLLVAGHALSRAGSVALMRFMVYVRVDTGPKAKPLADGITGAAFLVALVFGILPLAGIAHWFDDGWLLWLGVLPVGLAAWAAGVYFKKRIGGYTGDCLGAAQQVCEAAFYLFAVALVQGIESGAPPA